MNRFAVTLAAFAACLSCAGAQAQQHKGFYGGLSLSRMDVQLQPDGSPSHAPTAGSIVIGHQIDSLFAVELRLGAGLSGDSTNGREVKVKDYAGGYLKVFVPLSYTASLYGMAGYTSGKVESAINGGATTRTNDNDLSFGVGGSFAINRLNFVTVEVARLFAGPDVTVNALSAGFNMRF